MNIILVAHATGGKLSKLYGNLSPEEKAANRAILENVRNGGRGLSREEVDDIIAPPTVRPLTGRESMGQYLRSNMLPGDTMSLDSRGRTIITHPSNRRGRGGRG